jgi:hypothetical protein
MKYRDSRQRKYWRLEGVNLRGRVIRAVLTDLAKVLTLGATGCHEVLNMKTKPPKKKIQVKINFLGKIILIYIKTFDKII